MTVKRCKAEDIDKIYKIEEKSFTEPIKKETFALDLQRDNYYCYGLYKADITAFISYEKVLDEAQIISVAVDPAFRRRGYGRLLFEEVIKAAHADGIRLMTLEVRADNVGALKLYTSLGFEQVGQRRGYYQNPVCDAILMDLHIGKE